MLLASRSLKSASLLDAPLLGLAGTGGLRTPSRRRVRTSVHAPEDPHGGNIELKTLPAIRNSQHQTPGCDVGVVKLDMNATAISLRKSAVLLNGREPDEGAPWWFTSDPGFSSSSTDSHDESGDSSSDDDFDEGLYSGSSEKEGLGLSSAPTINKASFEVLRLKDNGSFKFTKARRRDILRKHRLQHRDFRRIDPSIDFNKTSPSITIKESVLLICIGGVRALVTASQALLFEPNSIATRKFFDLVSPNLRARRKGGAAPQPTPTFSHATNSHQQYMSVLRGKEDQGAAPPFELIVLEGALLVATGQLDAERRVVANQVQNLMTKLPGNVNPVNLEELRRVKSVLVELETKADTVRRLLEELMDDDDEMRELNLSSRPVREERRRQRERDKLKRELERAREAREDREEDSDSWDAPSSSDQQHSVSAEESSPVTGDTSSFSPSSHMGHSLDDIEAQAEALLDSYGKAGRVEGYVEVKTPVYVDVDLGSHLGDTYDGEQRQRGGSESASWSGERGREEGIQDAQDALEEMAEQEQEQEDLEEVEEVLQYYHQRAGSTESEAGRLLQGARDLEESIRVSLSAARYEVDRLELMLSIGSFAAAIGAMFAGIFGMNMRSNLEASVSGFWATTIGILLGCVLIFWKIMAYVRNRNIL